MFWKWGSKWKNTGSKNSIKLIFLEHNDANILQRMFVKESESIKECNFLVHAWFKMTNCKWQGYIK